MDKKRLIFAVVAAEVHSIEQRQVLKGIISQAQKLDIDIAVISNVYNPFYADDYSAITSCENMIYELINSPDIDGIIMISESFVNVKLRNKIKDILLKLHVPIIIAGANLDELYEPVFKYINTSDVNDIMDVTDHLIEVHNFRDIHIVSGQENLEVSQLRVKGYQKSLENHGIPFDKSKVFYGDFWMTSGEALAERYISGELALPEAIICCNDYMAFGLIDRFVKSDISVPEDVTVIGYEYVLERELHSPILTTYQRNRMETGLQAVNYIYEVLNGHKPEKFIPPKGQIIYGTSCTCGVSKEQINHELTEARKKKQYYQWNLFNQMEQQLTACRTIEELSSVAGSYEWNIRDVRDIYLCLFNEWYKSDSNTKSEFVSCRSIIPWFDNTPFSVKRLNFSKLFERSDSAAAYYCTPLFFSERLFGYIVLKYDKPDTYDDIFRNWLKSVSNALEFLRMKNDINVLLECHNLSAMHDTTTGLLNKLGLENDLGMAVKKAEKSEKVLLAVIKTDIFSDSVDINKHGITVKTDMEISDILKSGINGSNEICGKVSERLFVYAAVGNFSNEYAELISDRIATLITHTPIYSENFGFDSIIIKNSLTAVEDFSFSDILEDMISDIENEIYEISNQRRTPNYSGYEDIRNRLYMNPKFNWSIERECRTLNHSTGYFRSTYKKMFGISFHQDVIRSRISLAKHLILTTSLSLSAIAEKCGYDDDKYFFRQFKALTSVTPNQYKFLS